MQAAARDAVKIRNEFADDAAEANDVEVRVLDLEGIEGPFDQLDPLPKAMLALLELQGTAHTAIAVFGEYSEEM